MSGDLSNLNLGPGNQPFVSGSGGAQQVEGSLDNQAVKAPPGVSDKDTIEKLGEVIASLYLQSNISTPILFPPDANNIAAITHLAMDKICLSILDNWSKSLQEIADQKREDEKRAELNPTWKDLQMSAGVVLSIVTIFIRAIFGTQAAEALLKSNSVNIDKVIADRFATNLATWGLNGVLKGYMLTILDQMPSTAKLSEGDKILLGKQLEIMVLASALGALYKVDTKWLTAEEFVNLLTNPTLLTNPNAQILAALILKELGELPPEKNARTVRMLMNYMNSNPDLPTLMNLGESTEAQVSILNSSAA